MSQPILVTGIYRSGSTWLGQMLAESEHIKYYGEPFNPINHKVYGISLPSPFYQLSGNEDILITKLKNAIGIDKNLNTFLSRLSLNHGLLNNSAKTYRYLNALFRCSSFIPLIKDPFALFSAEILAEKLNSDVVIIIRHPAAFVHSVKRMNWVFNFSWLLDQRSLMKGILLPFEDEINQRKREGYYSSIIKSACLVWKVFHYVISHYHNRHSNWVYVRHEDLSNDPINQFELIYKLLGLTMTDRVVQAIQRSSNKQNIVEAPAREAFALNRNSKANIKTWKKHLSEAEIEEIRKLTTPISKAWYSEADW
ncbi:MAG: sulfotransferase [Cyclobacteriaceae bacterium]